jgi:ketosteroid isomerase-like protein
VDDRSQQLVERLFDAFNRRDAATIVDLCDDRMEFFAVTAEEAGRTNPYVGKEGLSSYLEDVARIWEELLITPTEVEQQGDSLIVRGRVYLRSRALGIRDMPAAWIWDLHEGRFIRGRAFADPEDAVRSFSRAARQGQSPDLRASRSTTPLR